VSARSGAVQLGYASYYSDTLEGNPTASGAPYDPTELTAAHRTLPLGTRVAVTRTDTGRSVVVLVNDRGPYAGTRRIVDLSRAAARRLDMLRAGVVPVRLEVLSVPASRARR
jgi:rare lipoprotein A